MYLTFMVFSLSGITQITVSPEILANRDIKLVVLNERHTDFKPAEHGFKFANTFYNKVTHEIVTGGRCFGMVYTALDYYNAGKPIPQQDYRPGDYTSLSKYIYDRQFQGMAETADKFFEILNNPFGWRTSEFFNWGLQGFNGGRLEELRSFIDAGKPVPLGLYRYGSSDLMDGTHHAVLAIGYKMGRYKGDLKEHKKDLRIMVYDPNKPDAIRVIKPLPDRNYYVFEDEDWMETDESTDNDDARKKWHTYIVDKRYSSKTPPNVPQPPTYPNDNKVHELQLLIWTGGDDLRGGNNDNVDVKIEFTAGAAQLVRNANVRERWPGGSLNFLNIKLDRPVFKHNIKSVSLLTHFRGGISGDNWNVTDIVVKYRVNNRLEDAIIRTCKTTTCKDGNIVRFTGNVHEYKMYSTFKNPEQLVSSMGILIKSNYDVLVKGNKLRARVQYSSGEQWFDLTDGRQWERKTFIAASIPIPNKKKGDIKSITIYHQHGAGILKLARWRMSELRVNYTVNSGGSSQNMLRKRNAVLHDFRVQTPSVTYDIP